VRSREKPSDNRTSDSEKEYSTIERAIVKDRNREWEPNADSFKTHVP